MNTQWEEYLAQTPAADFFKGEAKAEAYLKMGLLGEAGAGKTHTAAKVAIGLHKLLRERGVETSDHVYFLESERGLGHVKPLFDAAGIKVVPRRSRAFVDLIPAFRRAALDKAILIVDSITHFWEELVSTYTNKLGRKRGLEISDWHFLKGVWWRAMDEFNNLPAHIILCGRAGDVYETYQNEAGKREAERVGVKMRAEKNTAYEPAITVLMERTDLVTPDNPERTGVLARVIKDRTDTINGATFYNPEFSNFRPHIDRLDLGGAHEATPIDQTSAGIIVDTATNRAQWEEKGVVVDEIDTILGQYVSGQSAEAKKRRLELLVKFFGTPSTERLSTLRLSALKGGLQNLHMELAGKPYFLPTGQPIISPEVAPADIQAARAATDAASRRMFGDGPREAAPAMTEAELADVEKTFGGNGERPDFWKFQEGLAKPAEEKSGKKWPDDYDPETVAMSGGTGAPAKEYVERQEKAAADPNEEVRRKAFADLEATQAMANKSAMAPEVKCKACGHAAGFDALSSQHGDGPDVVCRNCGTVHVQSAGNLVAQDWEAKNADRPEPQPEKPRDKKPVPEIPPPDPAPQPTARPSPEIKAISQPGKDVPKRGRGRPPGSGKRQKAVNLAQEIHAKRRNGDEFDVDKLAAERGVDANMLAEELDKIAAPAKPPKAKPVPDAAAAEVVESVVSKPAKKTDTKAKTDAKPAQAISAGPNPTSDIPAEVPAGFTPTADGITAEHVQNARAMMREGKTLRHIAEALGVDRAKLLDAMNEAQRADTTSPAASPAPAGDPLAHIAAPPEKWTWGVFMPYAIAVAKALGQTNELPRMVTAALRRENYSSRPKEEIPSEFLGTLYWAIREKRVNPETGEIRPQAE